MKSLTKVVASSAMIMATLSLSACGPAPVNHAAAACDAYDEVVTAENGTDINAITTANAGLAATLAVWQGEGGKPADLYEKLSGYAGALEGFMLDGSPESAKAYIDYKDAESSNIESLCTAARG